MKYQGRRGVILWAAAGLVLAMAVMFVCMLPGDSAAGRWITVIVCVLISALVLSFLIRNHVILTRDELRVCLGPTTTKVPVSAVVSVRRVTSCTAAVAGSSKRLEIGFRTGSVTDTLQLAVQDEDGFIRALCGYNQAVRVAD